MVGFPAVVVSSISCVPVAAGVLAISDVPAVAVAAVPAVAVVPAVARVPTDPGLSALVGIPAAVVNVFAVACIRILPASLLLLAFQEGFGTEFLSSFSSMKGS